MLRLGEPQKLTPMRGERNYLVYIPLGVGVIIPPWNFPCAIMAGMTAGALGTGKNVGVEPAAGRPAIAAEIIGNPFLGGVPNSTAEILTKAGGADCGQPGQKL